VETQPDHSTAAAHTARWRMEWEGLHIPFVLAGYGHSGWSRSARVLCRPHQLQPELTVLFGRAASAAVAASSCRSKMFIVFTSWQSAGMSEKGAEISS
jgi:hypothetical protein